MPAASSIYWNSVGSQRSSESSADTGSSRQYVDPWDLENYAYLRRHSVATAPQNVPPPSRAMYSRASHRKSEPEPEYWYSPREPTAREPGYLAPASVEEIYFAPPKYTNPTSYYQPISDDQSSRYAPLYQPLSDLDYQRFEDLRIKEVPQRRKVSRAKVSVSEIAANRNSIYHSTSRNVRRESVDNRIPKMVTKNKDECYIEVIPPSKLGLNTYGHLKIDYSNSWNSLHRKITK